MTALPTLLPKPSPRVAIAAFERIAQAWNVDVSQSAVLLGVSERTAYRWLKQGIRDHAGASTLERISHLIFIWEGVAALFGRGDVADTWVNRPNRDFGERTPLEHMLRGNVQDLLLVRNYIDRARQGW